MQNKECNFKLIEKGPKAPSWFKVFVDEEFKPAIVELNLKIDRVEKSINSRIDNLVKKNNLKE